MNFSKWLPLILRENVKKVKHKYKVKEVRQMKRKLSPWCKAVKIAMIQKDWGVADLAQAVKMTKEYNSAVINGRVISEPAVKVISDVLNIEQTALTSSE